MNSTLHEILNNERVNKKLHYLFSPAYYENIRPILRKMKLKHMVKLEKSRRNRVMLAYTYVSKGDFRQKVFCAAPIC